MNPIHQDRQLLLAYYRDGSHEAFGQLVGKFSPMVFQTALRRTRDHSLAEDVTQAVFIVLARRAGSLKTHESIAGWLHQTAIFASCSALRTQVRQRKREKVVAKPEAIFPPPPDESADRIARIEEELHRLPAMHRNVLVLHYLEGRPMPETAEMLGVSYETARKRLSRALERLRKRLGRVGSVCDEKTVVIAVRSIGHASRESLGESAAIAGGEIGRAFTLANNVIRTLKFAVVKKFAAVVMAIAFFGGVVSVVPSRSPQSIAAVPELKTPEPIQVTNEPVEYSIEQVVAAVKSTLHAIQTFTATSSVVSEPIGARKSWQIDSSVRFKRTMGDGVESFDQIFVSEEKDGQVDAAKTRTVTAYDGSRAYILLEERLRNGKTGRSAEVLPKMDSRFYSRALTVFSVATHLADVVPIDRILENGTFRVLGRAQVDGQSTIVVYGSSALPLPGHQLKDGSPGMYIKFFLRPNAGFMPVRQEWYVVNDATPQGRLSQVYTCVLEPEKASQIWFPVSGTSTTMADGKVVSHLKLTIRDLKLDPPLTDDDFRIQWPPGTTVLDAVQGVSFVIPPEAPPEPAR